MNQAALSVPQKQDVTYEKPDGNLKKFSAVKNDAGDPMLLIRTLEAQWNAERVLEADAASVMVASTILGFTSSRYWFLLAGAVGLFLLEHAIVGRRPPASGRRGSGRKRRKSSSPKPMAGMEIVSSESPSAPLPPE